MIGIAIFLGGPITALAQTDPPVITPTPLAAVEQNFDARQKALDARTAASDYDYAVTQHNCYSKFFVNHCLRQARDKFHTVRLQIREDQLALSEEQRAWRVRQRDEQIAIKRARDAALEPQRMVAAERNQQQFEEKQRQHALDAARRNAQAPQREANQQAYSRKQAEYQRKLDAAHNQAVQKQQERERNVQRYEQKQSAAAQHKADVEARQKQAEEKLLKKQQQLQAP